MKTRLYISAVVAVLVTSCTSLEPSLRPLPAGMGEPAAAPQKRAQYLALPGQAVVAVGTDADAAFNQHAASYHQVGAPQQPLMTPVMNHQAAAIAAAPTATASALVSAVNPVSPMQAQVVQPQMGMNPASAVAAAPAMASGPINYKVSVTNNTPGRLFVEAQDAAGTIFPCGFMSPAQTITTPMEQANPIKGPVTIVVRDPDKPDAPEIRRYKVDAPSGYANKTFGVSIIPGGIYQTSLDGMVYYTSPPQPRSPQPVAPAAPAAEPAPAAAPAPAAKPATPAPAALPAEPAIPAPKPMHVEPAAPVAKPAAAPAPAATPAAI